MICKENKHLYQGHFVTTAFTPDPSSLKDRLCFQTNWMQKKKKNSLTHTYKFKAVYDKGQMNCKYKNYSTQCKADMALDAPLFMHKINGKTEISDEWHNFNYHY